MTSGKLDEELGRMAQIADLLRPGAVVLFNESFAATNEREGSEIARQVVQALRDSGVTVWFVTHLHDFARSQVDGPVRGVLSLRAPRQDDGRRTFRLVPGDPLPTGYGPDLYARIFGTDPQRTDKDAVWTTR